MTDDLDRIMAVMQTAFDPAYGEAWTRRQVGDSLLLSSTHYLLAAPHGGSPSENDATAGFVMSRGTSDEEELLLIGVDPKFRRQGVGSALIKRFITEATARGAKRLFLEMREGNSAEALYEAHGFSRVARRPAYYRRGTGPPIDAITFARGKQPLPQ